MKEIKDAQKKWRVAKAKVQADCEKSGRLELAKKLADCKMFTGEESLSEMVDLMFSPQGVEFLTRSGFPDIQTFRKFKKYKPELLGVWIDSGEVTLTDNKRVFLVGDTTAKVMYNESQGNRLVLMHGAKATVEASGWAVVKIEKDGKSAVTVKSSGHAKVLQ